MGAIEKWFEDFENKELCVANCVGEMPKINANLNGFPKPDTRYSHAAQVPPRHGMKFTPS